MNSASNKKVKYVTTILRMLWHTDLLALRLDVTVKLQET